MVRHVAGVLGWQHGMPFLEPWAFGCEGVVVVPDFAASSGALAAVPLGTVAAALSRRDAPTCFAGVSYIDCASFIDLQPYGANRVLLHRRHLSRRPPSVSCPP